MRPIENSYELPTGVGFAGQYPGDSDDAKAREKIREILNAGVGLFVDLTEADEHTTRGPMKPYKRLLEDEAARRGVRVRHVRVSVPDQGVPRSDADTRAILDMLDAAKSGGPSVYLHCWGGKGRTGTIVACHLMRHNYDCESALRTVQELAHTMPKGAGHDVPENEAQRSYVREWSKKEPPQR